MAIKIQIRRDVEANWISVDPVLAEGELGLSTDISKLKVGDGVSLWSELDYINTSDVNWGDIGGTLSDQFDLQDALDDKQAVLGFTPENVANKATDLTSPDNTKYPTTQAVVDAIATATIGLLDYRGSYDASTNLFPATGGSGVAGAILKGDFYICSVSGTLGTTSVTPGDLIIALVDTPAQTASNWDLISHDINYVPENVANKSTGVVADQASNTKYPSVKSVYDWAVATFQAVLGFTPEDVANKDTDGTLSANSDAKYASQKATKTYADGKVSDTSFASSWDGVTTISPSKNSIYDQDFEMSNYIKGYRALGATLLAQCLAVNLANLALSSNLVDGEVFFSAIYIPRKYTLTGVMWRQNTQGAYTADNNNRIGLYSYSGGTLTLVASCANDGNLWKGASATIISKAFSATYDADPGIYFIGALYNQSAQSTQPVVSGGPAHTHPSGTIFTNSAKLNGTLASQANLPSSQAMSGITESTTCRWYAVY